MARKMTTLILAMSMLASVALGAQPTQVELTQDGSARKHGQSYMMRSEKTGKVKVSQGQEEVSLTDDGMMEDSDQTSNYPHDPTPTRRRRNRDSSWGSTYTIWSARRRRNTQEDHGEECVRDSADLTLANKGNCDTSLCTPDVSGCTGRWCHHTCNLNQAIFDRGTVTMCVHGATYKLTENIVFEPKNSAAPDDVYDNSDATLEMTPKLTSTKYWQGDGYFLGFFAAISVEGKDMTLDCQGKEIKMSDKFHKRQRFFSVIELASKPFVEGAGPPPFANGKMTPCEIRPALKVVIKDCKLGKSSHHGIHGNEAVNVMIKRVDIYDFEVAGIAVNGGRTVKVRSVDIGPSLTSTFPSALSQTVFLNHMVNTMGRDNTVLAADGSVANAALKAFIEDSERTVTLRGQSKTVSSVFDDLKTALTKFLNSDTSGSLENLLKKGAEGSELPDGSAIYGAVFHKTGPAVGDFGNHPSDQMASLELIDAVGISCDRETVNRCWRPWENTYAMKIHDLKLNVVAWNTINMKKDPADEKPSQVQGPAGAVFRFSKLASGTCSHTSCPAYVGNALSDAQIAIYKVLSDARAAAAEEVEANGVTDATAEKVKADAEMYFSAAWIPQQIQDWAAGTSATLDISDSSGFTIGCHGDSMSHFNKGAMGLRFDFVNEPWVQAHKVPITNIENTGGEFELASDGTPMCSVTNYLGNDARGIVFHKSEDVLLPQRHDGAFFFAVSGLTVNSLTGDAKGNKNACPTNCACSGDQCEGDSDVSNVIGSSHSSNSQIYTNDPTFVCKCYNFEYRSTSDFSGAAADAAAAAR